MNTSVADAAGLRKPWGRAALWLLFLGPFFFLTYGLANWLASTRVDVGSVVFAWEHHIPFLPWTIFPYWSIDILYGISLFACASTEELDTHARRLLFAQVAAVVCFVLFPLEFTFAKPPVEGASGALFTALAGFDQPYNQAPSLHIALAVVLWALFARKLPPAGRYALHAWFALICVSVLTTYQHHFFDVPTGVWLGCLSVWMFPHGQTSLLGRLKPCADKNRRRYALRYWAGSLLIATGALVSGGWGLWLLWVAAATLLVGLIYWSLGAAAFQKLPHGGMTLPSLLLFAPYMAGAWVSARWWTRHLTNVQFVTPEVAIGRSPVLATRRIPGINAVVDLTAELPFRSNRHVYVNVPLLDLAPISVDELKRAAAAIESVVARGPVLVCCALGFSRSAAAIAAWLLVTNRVSNVADAVARIRTARPSIVLRADHLSALENLAPTRASQ